MAQVAPHSRRPSPQGRRHRHAAGTAPPTQSTVPTSAPGPDAVDRPVPSPHGDGPDEDPGVADAHRHRTPQRGRHANSYGQNYARVVGWTLLGSLLPGTGLIAAGRRTSGLVAVTLASLLVSVAVTLAVISDPISLLRLMVSQPDRFLILAAVLGALLLAWSAMVIGTHSALRRFAHLGVRQRIVCSLLVTTLIALVALPVAKTASYAVIMRDTLNGIFTTTAPALGARPDTRRADPWANIARVNVLLIGSDAGADRIGIRPDTLILASINTQTGDTVLFSLPRNLEKVPFPPGTRQAAAFPGGFDCVDANGVPQCLLNAFWTFGEEHWKEYYPDEPDAFHAGLRATSEAVEQVTGLPVDQYAMLNLRGFVQFVDAIGGITVNVKERLPIGGSSERPVASGWINPGPNQHLDGYHALWYARSRWSTDDYDRMRRQRCVIGAVVQQADPTRVALAFPQIAAAAKNNITTGIPLDDLGAWVELTEKVKQTGVRSLAFTSSVIDPANPDIAAMRDMVAKAINPPPKPSPSAAAPSPGVTDAATSGTAPTPAPGPSASENPSQAQDISAVC